MTDHGLVTAETRVIVQGITGKAARLHAKIMREYGTRVVAGVRPGAGGEQVDGVPVFETVAQAVTATDADASVLFVPAAAIRAAAFEAFDAGVKLVVMVPEHVPLHDTMAMVERAKELKVTLVGPNTPGLIRPSARCKIGFLPQQYYLAGSVAVASRSGTLTYELVSRLTAGGIGQSLCVGVGGDPIVGTTFAQLLRLFEEDAETRAVLLIGEIGGSMEEEAAELIVTGKVTKPVVAFLAGRNAPPDKRMGHAGAIVAGGRGTIESKLEAFARAGVLVADQPSDVVPLVRRGLGLAGD